MSETQVIAFPLPDAAARRRIQVDLDANLLVEAGAGSGKTTELVNRMVALVATGTTTVDHIAAVTFTRKAAGELRERFQARLEREVRDGVEGDPEGTARVRQALEDIDRAFVGTIHAFCSRLLRERPLEVGLDPAFQELTPEERLGFHRRFWEAYLERLVRDADPILEELNEAGLRTHHLFGLFGNLVENPDVDFPAGEVSPPSAQEIGAVRRELEVLVRRGRELMPAREPDRGWDSFQRKVRTAAFTLEVTGWKRPSDFFEALALLCHDGKGHSTTLKRWKDKDMAKALVASANAFGHGDTQATRLLDRWYAHRYALALRLAGKAARDFAEHRRRSGRLDFQDLLLLSARLLRGNAGARAELGRRYRHLLVDEFQDTDPLQAEIMLLLASEPGVPAAQEESRAEGDAPGPVADWRTAVPRPGALFVVGDPKQSIYRFRRADIQLYEFVRRRFADFGGLLELTSNFRSRPPIGDLVNEVFDHPDFFPAQATVEQARFEPLKTRPTERPTPEEGVFWYAVNPARDAWAAVAADDARRLATWIRGRLDGGERGPGDFLVLTRVTRGLSVYARAMEEYGIPVQVTGAGVGVEHELEELLALLECMIDPTDPVKVVAVLVGLFFGVDHERLLAHRLAGGSFDVIRVRAEGDPDIRAALGQLHRWWRSAIRDPADVFLGRVVPELGLLPFAAAGELGTLRAGALVYVLDAVRGAALAGDASLPGALEALRAALEAKEAEAPLQPGRDDVVRLMNLHQAKGLEAPVVVLADPSSQAAHGQTLHVERRPDGTATGWLRVAEQSEGFRRNNLLARPSEWSDKEAAEARFEAAEQVRLLYVATTRARDELLVSRWPAKSGGSAWAALDPWLEENGQELALEAAPPPARHDLELAADLVARRVDGAARALEGLGVPSFRHVSVTDVAKGGGADRGAQGPGSESGPESSPDPSAAGSGRFRGYSWGSAVHGALAASADDDAELALRAACRSLLVGHGRPLDDHGEPTELEELVALVRSVRASALWRRAAQAGRVLTEVPFAVPGVTRPRPPAPRADDDSVSTGEATPGGGGSRPPQRQLDLFAGDDALPAPDRVSTTESDTPGSHPVPSVLEGVIDLAFREPDGWVIADYKTDVGTDPDFPSRLETYRRQ
ncbi:MAG TPA: UvrD-helicase domain-containing protein, partial [Longimicrobiales bacterium]|nr:UvrD-helicase domain-containing protein [Longimicrobiales bacterium]